MKKPTKLPSEQIKRIFLEVGRDFGQIPELQCFDDFVNAVNRKCYEELRKLNKDDV